MVEEEFIERPTDVLRSYLAAHGMGLKVMTSTLRVGRIAMGMEILTVIKFLEDHKYLLDSADETIAVLTTLLVDQDILEETQSWYHSLHEWRRVKLYDAVAEAADTANASAPASQLDALPPPDSTDAEHDSSQTKDPPSAS